MLRRGLQKCTSECLCSQGLNFGCPVSIFLHAIQETRDKVTGQGRKPLSPTGLQQFLRLLRSYSSKEVEWHQTSRLQVICQRGIQKIRASYSCCFTRGCARVCLWGFSELSNISNKHGLRVLGIHRKPGVYLQIKTRQITCFKHIAPFYNSWEQGKGKSCPVLYCEK